MERMFADPQSVVNEFVSSFAPKTIQAEGLLLEEQDSSTATMTTVGKILRPSNLWKDYISLDWEHKKRPI
jgi:hypothetical protein